jgi:drug/metabolite transporter (DMT)-like permease
VATTAAVEQSVERTRASSGLWLALFSAATFGTSGVFGASLLDAGWSPGAAVAARIGGAALVLAVPTVLALRGRWHLLRQHAGLIVAYGLVAMAACQVFYFNAIQTLDVGVALLLEYLGPVLIIGWLWLRHGKRPSGLTMAGAALSIAGLVLVLDLTGAVQLDLVGVLWGLAAAVGLATYFVLSGHEAEGLPPVVLAGAGMVVAAVALLVVGVVGIMPFEATTNDVQLAGRDVSWVVAWLGIVLVATTVAYVSGIEGTRRLGSHLASFVGLTEVMFAVLFAWLFLGQLPGAIQLAGGVLIVAGVAVVRYAELADERAAHGGHLPVPVGADGVLPSPEGFAEAGL